MYQCPAPYHYFRESKQLAGSEELDAGRQHPAESRVWQHVFTHVHEEARPGCTAEPERSAAAHGSEEKWGSMGPPHWTKLQCGAWWPSLPGQNRWEPSNVDVISSGSRQAY